MCDTDCKFYIDKLNEVFKAIVNSAYYETSSLREIHEQYSNLDKLESSLKKIHVIIEKLNEQGRVIQVRDAEAIGYINEFNELENNERINNEKVKNLVESMTQLINSTVVKKQ